MGRSRALVCLAALFTLALASPPLAAVDFGRTVSFRADGLVSAVAAGDLNGDGNVDIVAPYAFTPILVPGDPTIGILVVLGDGRSAGATRNQPFGTALTSIALGDFNSDGKQDVVGTFDKGDGSSGIETLVGDGAGGLTEAGKQAAGAHPANIVSADLNRDGKPDVAVLDVGTNNVLVLLGTGSGDFGSPATLTLSRTPSHLTAADVNGDGKVDLVASSTGGVHLLYGDGAGGFPTSDSAAVRSHASAAGDVNGDGIMDVAAVTTDRNSYSVLLGRAGGGFTELAASIAGPAPRGVVISDLDLDGRPDLGTFGYESGVGKFGVYLGNGQGTFTGYATFTPGRVGGVIADYNRDGAPDVIIGAGQNPKSRQAKEAVNVDFNLPVLVGSDLTFKAQAVGLGARPRTLTLTNAGAAPMHISDVSVADGGSRDFSLAGDACSGQVILRQQTCTLKVAFVPHRLGGREAQVTVAADVGGGARAFRLTGTGKRIPGVGIRHRTLKVDDHGDVRLRVSCPGPRRCRGLLTIRSTNALVLKTPGTAHHVAIASTRFRLRSGQRTTIRVRASDTARRLVRTLRRLRVTVRASKQGAYVEHVAFTTNLRRRR